MKNVKIRIGNMKFGEACYIGDKAPAFPTYLIDVVEPNTYFYEFKKGYYKPDPEEKGYYRYVGPDEERRKFSCRYEKSCFEGTECSWAVAAFRYNENANCYELDFFRWREFLNEKYEEHRKDFYKLLQAISDSEIFDYDNIKPNEV